MTEDEKKGYLFYIYRVSEKAYCYKPVDPKYYSEESLKNFASKYAKDGILYKTEKECLDIVNELNKGLYTTFDFTSTNGVNGDGLVTVEDKGEIIVKFPSGQIAKIEVDSVRETIHIKQSWEKEDE